MKDIKKELHNQIIKYLIERFSKIIISPFEIQEMASKLSSKIARMMYNLSFYQFKRKLKEKCEENNIELEILPEDYTTKTCTKCGNIKENVKNVKLYKCEQCGLEIRRDFNGARNIMLKNNEF